jgi:hypothetical protein
MFSFFLISIIVCFLNSLVIFILSRITSKTIFLYGNIKNGLYIIHISSKAILFSEC